MTANANPLTNLTITNATADTIAARDVTLPTAGFTIAVSLNSVDGTNVAVPAGRGPRGYRRAPSRRTPSTSPS